MSSSDLSELSSSLSSEDEISSAPSAPGKLDHYFKPGLKAAPKSPPIKKKRPPSPPHEYVLADNPDIAFLCMFRSRFSDAFPKSLPHYGPQDIEHGVVDSAPGEQVERLLCALLALVLNRKKDIERGHHQRALEEAVLSNTSQWPLAWNGKNPLHGGNNFNKMTSEERLTLLKALVMWSLGSSEAVQAIIKEAYKQQRHDDDLNQPLSVQAWGKDGDKRRFWLIEGQDDTHFRLYRESNPALKNITWRNVAGTIDELKEVARSLGEDNTQASQRLGDRILAGVPRFEASEEKRKRRDYRMARKAQFTRAEPGFSLYEGRTRGKRIRYTYSDEEEGGSDTLSTRRSNRQSGISTPAEQSGPTFTASGRQVRSRYNGVYGETISGGNPNAPEERSTGRISEAEMNEQTLMSRGRPTRGLHQKGLVLKTGSRTRTEDYDPLELMDEGSDAESSEGDWDGEDDEVLEDDEGVDDEDMEMSDDGASVGTGQRHSEKQDSNVGRSLVVSLHYSKLHPLPLSIENRNKESNSKDHATAPSIPDISHNMSQYAGDTDDFHSAVPDATPIEPPINSFHERAPDGLENEQAPGEATQPQLFRDVASAYS